jgi:hypothetical protein
MGCFFYRETSLFLGLILKRSYLAHVWLVYGLSMAYLWLIAEGMPMDKLFKDIFEEGFLAAW